MDGDEDGGATAVMSAVEDESGGGRGSISKYHDKVITPSGLCYYNLFRNSPTRVHLRSRLRSKLADKCT